MQHGVTAQRTGMTVGRYRLSGLVGIDASVHAELWQARDTLTLRDVALTLVRYGQLPGGDHARRRTEDMITAAARRRTLEHPDRDGAGEAMVSPGHLRVLDVAWITTGAAPMGALQRGQPDADVSAVCVTEWVGGRSLAKVVSAPLGVSTALRMLAPLAREVRHAHSHGVVLGCGYPQRVRIDGDAAARVAFGLPDPSLSAADDVRGLGALLYLLLTGHWPLPATDDELIGIPRAPARGGGDLRVAGYPVAVTVLRPELPIEVVTLIMGALGFPGSPGRVRTAAAVAQVIDDLLTEAAAALLPPPRDGAPIDADEVWHTATFAAITPPRSRRLSVGITGLATGLVTLVAYAVVHLSSLLGLSLAHPPTIVITTGKTQPEVTLTHRDPAGRAGIAAPRRPGERPNQDGYAPVIAVHTD